MCRFVVSTSLLYLAISVQSFHIPPSIARHAAGFSSLSIATRELPTATVGSTPCSIKVLGVGGAGGNAVNRMYQTGIEGPDFWAINTDTQALGAFQNTRVQTLHIGEDVTKGLGAGGVPSNGRLAAESSRDAIGKVVEGTDLVFVTAGMGGGTGSGAAPVIAEMARKAGALTVAVVTKPFSFEGRPRRKQALAAIDALRAQVDTLITVSNDRLLRAIPSETSVEQAFAMADDVLRQAVIGVSDIIMKPGLVNVDFADVKSIMSQAGTALMGVGKAAGKNRAREAALNAITSPLLDFPIQKARGLMFNIVGGRDLQLHEVDEAADVIYGAVDADATIVFGAAVDEARTGGELAVTVIATGFPDEATSEPFRVGGVDKGRGGADERAKSRRNRAVGRGIGKLFSFFFGNTLRGSRRASGVGNKTSRRRGGANSTTAPVTDIIDRSL